jgi:cardiolipin synthase
MTIPNLLTILRVLLTPLLVIFLLEDRLSEALIVFVAAGITDGLDGLIARLYQQKTRLGAFLDPLADKLLLTTTYVLLAVQNLVPSWLTVIVLSRDVLIVLGVFVLFMQDLPFEIKPSLASKLTTCAQILTAIVTMATALASPHPLLKHTLFYLTGAVTLVSWGQYMVRGVRLMQEAGHNQKNTRH